MLQTVMKEGCYISATTKSARKAFRYGLLLFRGTWLISELGTVMGLKPTFYLTGKMRFRVRGTVRLRGEGGS
jgi:hypothetical protein